MARTGNLGNIPALIHHRLIPENGKCDSLERFAIPPKRIKGHDRGRRRRHPRSRAARRLPPGRPVHRRRGADPDAVPRQRRRGRPQIGRAHV